MLVKIFDMITFIIILYFITFLFSLIIKFNYYNISKTTNNQHVKDPATQAIEKW